MPSSYEFLVFSNAKDMQDAAAKSRIKTHAMKDIGWARRKPSRKSIQLEIRGECIEQQAEGSRDLLPPVEHPLRHGQAGYSEALYNPYVRHLSCQMDPFESAAIPIDSIVRNLVEYFAHYSTEYPYNFTFTSDVTAVLNAALQDDLTINCLLSAAAFRISYMQGTVPHEYRVKALHTTQSALHLLQQRLYRADCLTPSCVQSLVDCIIYLAAAALYSSDESSYEVHLNAAVGLLERSGGTLSLTDPRVLVRALSHDDLLACWTLTPCRINAAYHLYLPAKPSGHSARRASEDLTVPSHLLEDRCRALLPERLHSLVLEIMEQNESFQTIDIADGTTSDISQTRHLQILGKLSVRSRLLASPLHDHKGEALRLGLVVWTLLPPGDVRQTRTAEVCAGHLKHVLQQESIAFWAGDEDLRFWLLLVGFFAARTHYEIHDWFVTQLCDDLDLRADVLNIRTDSNLCDDLLQLQRRFLFRSDPLQQLTECFSGSLFPEARFHGTVAV